jgi:hypothetical protein
MKIRDEASMRLLFFLFLGAAPMDVKRFPRRGRRAMEDEETHMLPKDTFLDVWTQCGEPHMMAVMMEHLSVTEDQSVRIVLDLLMGSPRLPAEIIIVVIDKFLRRGAFLIGLSEQVHKACSAGIMSYMTVLMPSLFPENPKITFEELVAESKAVVKMCGHSPNCVEMALLGAKRKIRLTLGAN